MTEIGIGTTCEDSSRLRDVTMTSLRPSPPPASPASAAESAVLALSAAATLGLSAAATLGLSAAETLGLSATLRPASAAATTPEANAPPGAPAPRTKTPRIPQGCLQ